MGITFSFLPKNSVELGVYVEKLQDKLLYPSYVFREKSVWFYTTNKTPFHEYIKKLNVQLD